MARVAAESGSAVIARAHASRGPRGLADRAPANGAVAGVRRSRRLPRAVRGRRPAGIASGAAGFGNNLKHRRPSRTACTRGGYRPGTPEPLGGTAGPGGRLEVETMAQAGASTASVGDHQVGDDPGGEPG